MGATLERELGTGGELLTSATARAAALDRARERCRGVLAPGRVWRRPDGVVAVAFPVAAGASLAEVREGRALSVGECVTVGVGVADALAAMHAERLAHGDVAAANVVVHGRRVVLVDTMGALSEERGTPGFAAPERHEGASPSGDVFALGMLLRHLADDSAQPVIAAWTAPLLAADPAARPTAAHAAAVLARCAPTEAIRAPDAPVAAAIRAGAVERTARRRDDRWWRAQKAALKLSPVVVLAVALAVVVAGVVRSPAAEGEPVRLPPMAGSPGASMDASSAAEDLARRRIAALSRGDGEQLLALSVPGSESATTDAITARDLTSGALTFTGLTLEEVDATVVHLTPGGAVVEVTSALSDYGVGQHAVPPGTAVARLELVSTPRGWLVARILPRS